MNYQLQAPPPKKGVFSAFSCGTDRTGSFEVDFDKAPTGLYVLVHNKQWKGALDRLKHYPKEASTWIVRMGNEEGDVVPDTSATSRSQLRVTDARKTPKAATTEQIGGAMQSPSQMGKKVLRWRMLPLHAAVLFNAPVDLIQALLKAYPDACSKYDDQGMLPLHLAFRSGANEETILQLLDVYPNAIEQVCFVAPFALFVDVGYHNISGCMSVRFQGKAALYACTKEFDDLWGPHRRGLPQEPLSLLLGRPRCDER